MSGSVLENVGNARPDGGDHELGRQQTADTMERVALVFATVIDHSLCREEGCACLGVPSRLKHGVDLHIEASELALANRQRGCLAMLCNDRMLISTQT